MNLWQARQESNLLLEGLESSATPVSFSPIWCQESVTIRPVRDFNPLLIHLSYPGMLAGTTGFDPATPERQSSVIASSPRTRKLFARRLVGMVGIEPTTFPLSEGNATPLHLMPMEPKSGFEPLTYALQERCSTTELFRRPLVFPRCQLPWPLEAGVRATRDTILLLTRLAFGGAPGNRTLNSSLQS